MSKAQKLRVLEVLVIVVAALFVVLTAFAGNVPGDDEKMSLQSVLTPLQPVYAQNTQSDFSAYSNVSDSLQNGVFTPYIKVAENTLVLSVIKKEGERVSVKFYNSDGELLYIEDVDTAVVFKKKYNLDHLSHGMYKVEIKKGDQIFVENVFVR